MFTQKATIWFLTGFGWWVIIGQWGITLELSSFSLLFPLLCSSCSSVAVCCCLCSVVLFSCCCWCSVVTGHKYESSVVRTRNRFFFRNPSWVGISMLSNEENPMQEYFVPKARDSQINFSFAWKARMCKCRAEVSWKKATTTLWIRSCPEKIFHLKGIDWGMKAAKAFLGRLLAALFIILPILSFMRISFTTFSASCPSWQD